MRKFFYSVIIGLFIGGGTVSAVAEPAVVTPVEPTKMAVLSQKDLGRYTRIFALQEKGKWQQASRLIKQLDNELLLGHVLYQRYMHPTKYRSKYSELASWMRHYADHPDAWRIYRLALRRRGKASMPRRPVATNYPGVTGQAAPAHPALPRRKASLNKVVTQYKSLIRRELRRGRPARAERRFWAMERREILSEYERAGILAKIAAYYFSDGDDEKAHALAVFGARIDGANVARNHWLAGISAWRMGKYDIAAEQFSALSENNSADRWLASAGGFWASRALNQIHEPAAAREQLAHASQHRESFYGLLAAKQLGLNIQFDWTPPVYSPKAHVRMMTYPAAARAIALTQVGHTALADEELRLFWGRKGTAIQSDVLALSVALGLPAIQLRIGRTGDTSSGAMPPAVRYPLPNWEPVGGFIYDRAILFAFVRQESSFKARAKSNVGGHGLMQLMPATASYLTKDRNLYRRQRDKLYLPEFNMALGQQYIDYLLDQDYVQADLFSLLAAYNAGPGSLMRWQKNVEYHGDPLLFIEAIPFYETRLHIEKVMLNLWLYRMRLGQDTPTLEAVAAGAWPNIEILDTEITAAASRSHFSGAKAAAKD